MLPGLGEGDRDCPSWGAGHSAGACSQHIDQLWINVLAVIHGKQKLLWPAPVCECKQKYLNGSLTPCPFSKSTVVGPLLRPMASPVTGFDQVYCTRDDPFRGMGLKYNWKSVGYYSDDSPLHLCTHLETIYGLLPVNITDDFSSLEA